MNIQELKQKMEHVPDHTMRHSIPMNKKMSSKAKAFKKFKPKGYPDKFTSAKEQETE